jgi:hypothetical protein
MSSENEPAPAPAADPAPAPPAASAAPGAPAENKPEDDAKKPNENNDDESNNKNNDGKKRKSKKKGSPDKKKSRPPNFTDDDDNALFAAMETHLPHGQHGWESVTADFNAAMTDAGRVDRIRVLETLKNRYTRLRNNNKTNRRPAVSTCL